MNVFFHSTVHPYWRWCVYQYISPPEENSWQKEKANFIKSPSDPLVAYFQNEIVQLFAEVGTQDAIDYTNAH